MPFCGRIFSSDVFSKLCRKCGGGLSFFASTPLSIFVNGNIAAQYFFTLTGFLVCRSVILKNSVTIDTLYKKIINRYIRLWVVAAAAILFTFITMVCKVQYHLMASEFTENSTFLLDYCNFKPTVFNLLLDIFVRPYLRNCGHHKSTHNCKTYQSSLNLYDICHSTMMKRFICLKRKIE